MASSTWYQPGDGRRLFAIILKLELCYWLLRALINIFTSDWYASPGYLDCRCLIRMSKTSAAKNLYNTSKTQQKLRKTEVFGTKASTFIELRSKNPPNLKWLKKQPGKKFAKKNTFLGSPFETSSFLPSCYASIVGWLVGHRHLLAEICGCLVLLQFRLFLGYIK